jgi:cytochrome c oxidase accessory protein FixG
MFDSDTLIITYDEARGDPRGGRSKKADAREQGLGDCVDCGICVQVCPTGIDIRDGLQVECIGCAACIDACDQVMDKMDYPRGLIRYSTENALKNGLGSKEIAKRAFRPRTLVYSAVFLVLSAATAWSLTHRPPLRVDIVRDRGVMSREADDGSIENVFHLQLINTTEATRRYEVSVSGIDGIHLGQPAIVSVPGAGAAAATITVRVGAENAETLHGARPIRFTLADVATPDVRVEEPAKFWLP